MRALPAVLMFGDEGAVAGEAINSNDDDSYVDLPPVTSIGHYSFCGWARMPSADGNNHCPFNESKDFGLSAVAFNVIVQDTGDGSSIVFATGNGNMFCESAPVANQWFFFAFRKSNSVVEGMWCSLAETEFDPARQTGNESSFGSGTPQKCSAGAYAEIDGFSIFGGIDVCQVRRWTASLTDEEFLAEKDSISAVRTLNLFSDNPFFGAADLIDHSGNGNDGDIVGSVTSVPDGPGNGG